MDNSKNDNSSNPCTGKLTDFRIFRTYDTPSSSRIRYELFTNSSYK